MKNFLEGEGFEVNKKKGEKSLEFKDTYSIITSNELPLTNRANEWEPFIHRCEFVEL